MQREIKFKFWLGQTKKMTYEHTIKGIIEVFHNHGIYTDDIIPLQFIGLKDKNGTEIYEGDVYRDTIEYEDQDDEYLYFICAYVKSQSAFCWVLNADYELGFHELDVLPEDIEDYGTVCNYDLDKIQLIGNIFEKPELLTN